MQVVGLPKAFYYVACHTAPSLSPKARERVRWLSCFQALREEGLSSARASQALGIPRSTLYRWLRRLNKEGPEGLEERSRKPKHRRQPTWSLEMAQAVLAVREEFPRWGKDKLVVVLRGRGWQVSTSMVGRILIRLKARGLLREPPRNGIWVRRQRRPRPYGVRKPKEYGVKEPGDLVQVDTLDVRPLPGVTLKHFTARDVVSRWDVVEAHSRATAITAVHFLGALLERMPFPVKALQVDGGSEFQAAFEEECQKRDIRLFILPPRSPKLNGRVERAHRTHTEEFYQLYDGELEITTLNRALLAWERTYNTIRPHQALDWRTPQEYLIQCHPELALQGQLSHM